MEVQRFAIHDGPGIRSTVFLQGCPLRCPWCANPESQTIGRHLMYQEQKCVQCGACAAHCPQQAIQLRGEQLIFDRQRCIQCGTCAEVCLNGAIHYIGMKTSVEDIVGILKRDEAYYRESGGGVTFSGGEPFVQFDALKALLGACHKLGYHTAIETTGNTSWEKMLDVLPLVDLFLFDMKHCDPDWITVVTGGDGWQIQDNFEKLARIAADKIITRVPVIPDYNFTEETLCRIFRFVADRGVKRVDLLPYHTLGTDKYMQLGREYLMGDIRMLPKKDLWSYIAIGKEYGLEVRV